MLKSFREKEMNVVWSEWKKEIHKHSETLESLKCSAQGIVLYSTNNEKLLGNI